MVTIPADARVMRWLFPSTLVAPKVLPASSIV